MMSWHAALADSKCEKKEGNRRKRIIHESKIQQRDFRN